MEPARQTKPCATKRCNRVASDGLFCAQCRQYLRAMCQGKQRYRTETRALTVLAKMIANPHEVTGDPHELAAYHCPCCEHWHLGHPVRRNRDRHRAVTDAAKKRRPEPA